MIDQLLYYYFMIEQYLQFCKLQQILRNNFHILNHSISFLKINNFSRLLLYKSFQQLILLIQNIMQISLDQMGFQISANLLHDCVIEKQQTLISLQQQFAHEFIIQKESDLHMWLISYVKKTNKDITHLCDGVKDYLSEIRLPFLFSFFQKCIDMQSQACKYLIQALNERINHKIDCTADPPLIQSKLNTVEATQKEEFISCNEERRRSRQAGKDIQDLDCFLNLLSYEENKNYQQYRSQCDKLLIHRQSVESIKPSQASRQIMETAYLIQNVMDSTDKLFKQSYLLRYMQFKTFLSNIPQPEILQNVFQKEMGKATRNKFRQGITRTLKNMARIDHQHRLYKLVNITCQTDQSRNKIQDKWQTLLLTQKKNNQKLSLELQKLKRNSSNSQYNHSQILLRLQKEQRARKQLQNKYQILQTMYNQKCTFIQDMEQKLIIKQQNGSSALVRTDILQAIKKMESKFFDSCGTQTIELTNTLERSCQTNMDFQNCFQNDKISDLQHKCKELQHILKQKQYIIEQNQAIKTFRDNFTSKKQDYTTVEKSNKITSVAKSLRYLQDSQDIYNEKYKYKIQKGSIGLPATKKQVKFEDNLLKDSTSKRQFVTCERNIKKTEIVKNKQYFALNDQIIKEEGSENIFRKIQEKQISQISLKYVSQHFVTDYAVQTDSFPSDSQQNSNKNNIFNKNLFKNDQNNIMQETISNAKNIRIIQKSQITAIREKMKPNSKKQRKSNFISFQKLNYHQNISSIIEPDNLRKSDFSSPILMKIISQQSKSLSRRSKKYQNNKTSRIANNELLIQGNQGLYVSNLLNVSLFEPHNTNQSSFGKAKLTKDTRNNQYNINKYGKKIF